jgi:hypothetical protein
LIAPETAKQYVLTEENGPKEVDRFVWSAAKYSDNVVVARFNGQKDGDFTDAKTLATTSNSTQVAILVKEEQTAIELGAEPGVPTLFDVKVRSSVSGGVSMISEAQLQLVLIHSGLIAYSFTDWYLIGAAVQGGWDNNADTNHQQCLETEQLLTNTLYGILWRRKL